MIDPSAEPPTRWHIQDCFDFAFIELAEKLGRFAEFIRDSARDTHYVDRRTPVIAQAFETALAEETREFEKSLRLYFTLSHNRDDLLSVSGRIFNYLHLRSDNLQENHSRLRHFPGGWAPTDLYVFADDVCRGVKWPGRKATDSVSSLGTIVLDDSYELAELNREQWLQSHPEEIRHGIVREKLFLIPKVERENPTVWPMLLHEIGHNLLAPPRSLASARQILQKAFGSVADGPVIADNWTREIAADLFAVDLLGPVYLATFISLVLSTWMQPLVSFTATHPPVTFRVDYMKQRLLDLRVTSAQQPFGDVVRHLERLETRNWLDVHVRDGLKDQPSWAAGRGNALHEAVLEAALEIVQCTDYVAIEKPGITTGDITHAIGLVDERLTRGIPIGSFSIAKPAQLPDPRSNRIEAMRLLTERPNSIPQIATAAAVFKVRLQLSSIKEVVDKGLDSFQDRRRTFDALIRRSMEMSLIHQFFNPA